MGSVDLVRDFARLVATSIALGVAFDLASRLVEWPLFRRLDTLVARDADANDELRERFARADRGVVYGFRRLTLGMVVGFPFMVLDSPFPIVLRWGLPTLALACAATVASRRVRRRLRVDLRTRPDTALIASEWGGLVGFGAFIAAGRDFGTGHPIGGAVAIALGLMLVLGVPFAFVRSFAVSDPRIDAIRDARFPSAWLAPALVVIRSNRLVLESALVGTTISTRTIADSTDEELETLLAILPTNRRLALVFVVLLALVAVLAFSMPNRGMAPHVTFMLPILLGLQPRPQIPNYAWTNAAYVRVARRAAVEELERPPVVPTRAPKGSIDTDEPYVEVPARRPTETLFLFGAVPVAFIGCIATALFAAGLVGR